MRRPLARWKENLRDAVDVDGVHDADVGPLHLVREMDMYIYIYTHTYIERGKDYICIIHVYTSLCNKYIYI